ncbi:ImmA/IrrE family metallo-endopeptidase [Fructobacillus sp. CRL 2054]|uniref:ImmA/IrrE family metallo-endopeptidase n=1 Tax=Fructobacillus sp. CRL 2054 TaxID=2763007 RepID=UPI00237899AE|nr:ImmA/IrrE family metallo-endopeptidase [Fructobacillus sp. CRL 2054]MDD9138778.1 ImmA/IrrE family metallo-endopeptidase [Fructobacillus sp. CRL 2054]
MNNNKTIALVALAEEVRQKIFCLEDNRALFEKLEGMGVELLGFFDEEISALLKWDNVYQHPIIAVNDRDSEKKQIFSLAHEIGHLFIDYGWLPEPYKNQNDFNDLEGVLSITHYRRPDNAQDESVLEQEAMMDDFARNFLMPYEDVKKLLADNGFHAERTIGQLVERYYVTELTARKQLAFVKNGGT